MLANIEKNNNDNTSEKIGKLLMIKTVQSTDFRVLIEALKEILQDVNIEYDESGFKIVAMDVSHTVLVHLKFRSLIDTATSRI